MDQRSLSLEHLVRVGAPEIVPAQPAFVAFDLNAAPIVGAAGNGFTVTVIGEEGVVQPVGFEAVTE